MESQKQEDFNSSASQDNPSVSHSSDSHNGSSDKPVVLSYNQVHLHFEYLRANPQFKWVLKGSDEHLGPVTQEEIRRRNLRMEEILFQKRCRFFGHDRELMEEYDGPYMDDDDDDQVMQTVEEKKNTDQESSFTCRATEKRDRTVEEGEVETDAVRVKRHCGEEGIQ